MLEVCIQYPTSRHIIRHIICPFFSNFHLNAYSFHKIIVCKQPNTDKKIFEVNLKITIAVILFFFAVTFETRSLWKISSNHHCKGRKV